MKAEDERSANKAAAAIQKRIAWVNSKLKSGQITKLDADDITGSDVVSSIKPLEAKIDTGSLSGNTLPTATNGKLLFL